VKWSYVYALICPNTYRVRYVGRTAYPVRRMQEHCIGPGNDLLRAWVRELQGSEQLPILRIIERCEPEREKEIEAFWIAHYTSRYTDIVNAHYVGSHRAKREFDLSQWDPWID
jgi:hypothetical protein